MIKIRLFMVQLQQGHKMQLIEPQTGMVSREYNKLGPKVTQCPFLLDPALSLEKAKQLH